MVNQYIQNLLFLKLHLFCFCCSSDFYHGVWFIHALVSNPFLINRINLPVTELALNVSGASPFKYKSSMSCLILVITSVVLIIALVNLLLHDFLSLIHNISCAQSSTHRNSQPSAYSYAVGQTGDQHVPQTHEKRAYETLKGRPRCYSAWRGKDSSHAHYMCFYMDTAILTQAAQNMLLIPENGKIWKVTSFEISVVTKGITNNSQPYTVPCFGSYLAH